MRILLTNDDGIDAPGIAALEAAFSETDAEVMVAAPDSERSGSSHSISFKSALTVEPRGDKRWAVSGTPVDTVHLAIKHLVKDGLPDLIVSGINKGANLACDVHYSGTAGAAREAALLDIPAFAISLETFSDAPDFGPAARFAVNLAKALSRHVMPPRSFLNVNLPDLPADGIKGVKVTTMGKRNYEGSIAETVGEDGKVYYVFTGAAVGGENIPESDIVAVGRGFISVTPMTLDQTHDCAMDWLRDRINFNGQGAPWK